MASFRLISSVQLNRAVLSSSRPALLAARRQPFHQSSAKAVGKESAIHNENRAQETEEAKQAQLKAQKEGKGQWSETLASDSESIIKADKAEGQTGKQSIEELQKESAKAAEQEKKSK